MFLLILRACAGISVRVNSSVEVLTTLCCAFRITLNKMPSIRESLQEMGVSVEHMLTEMAPKSTDDALDKAVPTPLTNYLDVGWFPRW